VCVDEVVEQGEQGFAGGADVADVVGEVVELEGLEVLGEQLAVADDCVERAADLAVDVGEQLGAGVAGPQHLAGALLEGGGEALVDPHELAVGGAQLRELGLHRGGARRQTLGLVRAGHIAPPART